MTKKRSRLFILWFAIATLLSLCGELVSAQRLSMSSDIKLDVLAVPPNTFMIHQSRWSHDTYLVLDRADPVTPSLYAFDRHGERLSGFTLKIPDAVRIWVHGFNRGSDGASVFTGNSVAADGQMAPFIAWVAADGQDLRVIRTAPYEPTMTTLGEDGTIWTVGYIDPTPGLDRRTQKVLRHFSSTGSLLDSFVPKASVSLGMLIDGYLVATKDRVGWYGPEGETGIYIELPITEGGTPHRYPGMPGSIGQTDVTGFALMDSGEAFLTYKAPDGTFTLYALDRKNGKWAPVHVPPDAPAWLPDGLYGADGDSLVFWGPHYVFKRVTVGQ